MIIDDFFKPKLTVVEASAANDYFTRRKSEEDRIAGVKAPAKNKKNPANTDYAKKRKQQDVTEAGHDHRRRAAASHNDEECSLCDGTGEGRHEGQSCGACGGSGVARGQYDHDDFEIPDKDDMYEGVAEGAPELLKKEMPTHRHAEKLLAQNGVSKDDPDYHHHLGNTIKYLRQFGNIDLINKSDEQGVAENTAAGINKMFNNLGDPVYANLQRVALLAMQGRQQEAAGRLQTVIKDADPAVQKKITDAVNSIKPVTINGRVADSSTLDKSKQHNDWIINTFIPWVQSLLGQQGVAEGGAETSWSNDTGTITLQDILELTKHIKQINLPINDNLKSKLLHWEGNPEEIERVNQVTVSNQFPILIMVDEQGQIAWILDGNHRLHKAIQSQAKTIPAKLIKSNDLNDKAKKIFNIKEQGVAEGLKSMYHNTVAKHHGRKADDAFDNNDEEGFAKHMDKSISHRLKAGEKIPQVRDPKKFQQGVAEGGSPSPYMSDKQAKKVMDLCRKGYTPDEIADIYPNLNKDEIDNIWGSMDDSELEQGMAEAKADPLGAWIAHKNGTEARKFKTREGAKKYVASHAGFTVSSSEAFHDTYRKKKVQEVKKFRTTYGWAGGSKEPRSAHAKQVATKRKEYDKGLGKFEPTDNMVGTAKIVRDIAMSDASPEHKKAAIDALNKKGVAEGLSKRDQKDVAAIKAAIERLEAQLKQPNADKESIQQSIAHERKRLALYKQGVSEDSPKDPNAPKLVQDRKTGKWYDPNKEFDKTMNKPEVKAQMKRMAQKEGVAEGLNETAQDLHIGDPVIITGNGIEFEGATGEIINFGQQHRFVVVDLYNHGRHSFHSSDVSFNEYAGSDDEEARMYDAGEFGDDDRDDMNEALMNKLQQVMVQEGRVKELADDLKTLNDAEFMKKYGKAKSAIRRDMKKVDEGNANSGRRNPIARPDNVPVKLGRIEKLKTGIKHHADSSRYGGTVPDTDDDHLLSPASRHHLHKAVTPDYDIDEARTSAAQRLSTAWDRQRAKSDASLARTPSSIPKKQEPKKAPTDPGAKTVSEHRVKRRALMAQMLNSH